MILQSRKSEPDEMTNGDDALDISEKEKGHTNNHSTTTPKIRRKQFRIARIKNLPQALAIKHARRVLVILRMRILSRYRVIVMWWVKGGRLVPFYGLGASLRSVQ